MESVLGRYRNLTILVGVLFLQVLGLAVQVKRSADAEHTRLIRVWAVDLIAPFERGLMWVQNGTGDLWHNYFFLRGVRAENRQLKEQIERMRLEQVRLSEDAAQARRLQSLLAFKEQVIAKTVPAQVIGTSGSDRSQSVYIDKGSNDGIAPDMAVISVGGIVGKVLSVYPSTSLVLMINDQSSGVGALLEKSRVQGVLRGTSDGELVLDRVMSDEQVAPGETVLSSGGDQIFPKGLPAGTVTKVSPGRELFLSIKVKPAADLSRLEEVLVVTEKSERQPAAENGVKVSAADILAQRLPSVPDKPAAIAAGATPAGGVANQGAAGGAKPQVSSAAKPLTGNAIKPVGNSPGVTVNSAATQSGNRSVGVAEQLTTAGGAKKAPPKSASGDSGVEGATGSGADASPENSSPKPPAPSAKPSNTQSTAKPPASEDDPH